MEQVIINNNKIIIHLLEEEEEDEIMYCLNTYRKPISNVFKTREKEGFFKVLINNHLRENKNKYREFFRLNYDQFHFILALIKDDITLPASNRIKNPISPDEKLAVTLRYIRIFLLINNNYGTIYCSLATYRFFLNVCFCVVNFMVRRSFGNYC